MRRNITQFEVSSDTCEICVLSGVRRFSRNSNSESFSSPYEKTSSCLKPTTVLKKRPSVSGSATDIAAFEAEKPRGLFNHASRFSVEVGT